MNVFSENITNFSFFFPLKVIVNKYTVLNHKFRLIFLFSLNDVLLFNLKAFVFLVHQFFCSIFPG